MSKERYFYTDPLAAAWMAKYFGMRFTARWLGPGPQREYECMADNWHFEVHDNRTGRYYIIPTACTCWSRRMATVFMAHAVANTLPSPTLAYSVPITP
jgi:hypothetical protein